MAVRTIANAGGNWSAAGTWVEGVVPTNADDVVATATSGNVTVDTATCTCKTMVLTNYVGRLTFTAGQTLTVNGTLTFVAGMTLAGTGTLVFGAGPATWTSAGLTFPGALTLAAGTTLTLAGNWVVTGLVTTTATITVNGAQITCNGGLANNSQCSGTTLFILGGGTWTGTNTVGISNPLTFAGNCTVSGTVYYKTGPLTYQSGVVTVAGSTLALTGNVTLALAGMTLNNLTRTTSGTTTLTTDLVIGGFLGVYAADIWLGAFNVTTAGLQAASTTSHTLTFPAGQTLTVTTYMYLNNYNNTLYQSAYAFTLKSGTAGAAMRLVYQGAASGVLSSSPTFTDVDASGGNRLWLINPTLTRCVNVETLYLPQGPKLYDTNGLLLVCK